MAEQNWRILHGDCLEVLATLPAESIDACVTDPPYGIGFMGKEWDTFKPDVAAGVRARTVKNQEASSNPNLKGRLQWAGGAPVEYDYTAKGLREFQQWTEAWGRAVFRVLKPGAHILVCGAPRAYHRMACGLEDAGFEIRDCLAWLFSSGFPKSLNFGCKCGGNAVSYIHAKQTAERDVRPLFDADVSPTVHACNEPRKVLFKGVSEQGASERGAERTEPEAGGGEQPVMEGRELYRAGEGLSNDQAAETSEGSPERLRAGTHRDRGEDPAAAAEAERGSASQGSRPGEQLPGKSANLRLPSRTLDGRASERRSRCERCGGLTEALGLGTALKPAHEPIVLARKPFKGTVAENFARFGTGALNIDAARIPFASEEDQAAAAQRLGATPTGYKGGFSHPVESVGPYLDKMDMGRWPANVALDENAAMVLDEQSGELISGARSEDFCRSADGVGRNAYGVFGGTSNIGGAACEASIGGASRFYYVAKPSREERDYGCEHLQARTAGECTHRTEGSAGLNNPRAGAGRTSLLNTSAPVGGGHRVEAARNFHPT